MTITEPVSRDAYLRQTIEQAQQMLKTLPEGRVSYKRGNLWVYQGPEKLSVLHSPQDQLLRELVLRSYLEKVIRSANQELNARTRYRKNRPSVKIEDIYDTLSLHRQELIQPIVPSTQQRIQNWLNQPYPLRNTIPIGDSFPTGVPSCPYVRSKSEIWEVQGMDREGLVFLYEFPLTLIDRRGRKKTIYPDFTILNLNDFTVIYWEHFGKMDSVNYLSDFKDKQELYAYNGIFGSRLYQTFEFSGRPLTMTEVNATIADIKRRAGY